MAPRSHCGPVSDRRQWWRSCLLRLGVERLDLPGAILGNRERHRMTDVATVDNVVIRFGGRLRRRDAADRRPVHPRCRGRWQRLLDAAQLPRRNPRTSRHSCRSVQLSAAVRRPSRPHSRRPGGRPGGDEPGGPEGQHRRPAQRRRPDRRQRRLHRAQPGQGGLHRGSAHRRQPGRLPGALLRPFGAGRRRGQRAGPEPARGAAHQEHVRARPAGLALHPSRSGHHELPGAQVRRPPAAAGRQRGPR